MATLSSSSTIDEIVAAYMDNASYDEDGSVAKARTFITACRLLLVKRPQRYRGLDGTEIELDLELIERQLAEARTWLSTHPDVATSSVKHFSLEDLRT